MYVPNIGEAKYIRQILTDLKREIDSSIIIVEDLDALLSIIQIKKYQ